MRRRPKRGTLAEAMLELLSTRLPQGVSTAELADRLFGRDTYQNRDRVRRLARTLRGMGFRVYGFGGLYFLCDGDEDKLERVRERQTRTAQGYILSVGDVLAGLAEACGEVRARAVKKKTRAALLKVVRKI